MGGHGANEIGDDGNDAGKYKGSANRADAKFSKRLEASVLLSHDSFQIRFYDSIRGGYPRDNA